LSRSVTYSYIDFYLKVAECIDEEKHIQICILTLSEDIVSVSVKSKINNPLAVLSWRQCLFWWM